MNILVEAQRKAVLQFLPGGVEQQNAEHLVVDQAPHQFRDPAKQLVEVQNRRQFACYFIEQQQNASLLGRARIELGVFNAGSHTRGDQRQNVHMLISERARLAALDVDDPNHAILGNQRDCQLRADIGNGLNVSRIFADIVNQYGLSRLSGQSGYAFAHLDSGPIGKFRRVSRLETEPKLLSLLVEQEDGKNLVVDYLADDFGDPAQRGVEVERCGEHVGDIKQQRLGCKTIRFGHDRTHGRYDSSRFPASYSFKVVQL